MVRKKSDEHIVTYVGSLPGGEYVIQHPDGTLERRKSGTDWTRVDAFTDEDIAEAVRNDPDAAPIDIDWSNAVLVVPPKKKAISIRIDEDVLDYFRKGGDGYQKRINAVLRSFMNQTRKPRKRA